jgi:hypothetical protein
MTIREGVEKIAFRAEVVVFGHLPGAALIPKQDLGGNSNFNFILAEGHVPIRNRWPSSIALASQKRTSLTL